MVELSIDKAVESQKSNMSLNQTVIRLMFLSLLLGQIHFSKTLMCQIFNKKIKNYFKQRKYKISFKI